MQPMLNSLGMIGFYKGANRILLPMASVKEIPTIHGELMAKSQTGFHADCRSYQSIIQNVWHAVDYDKLIALMYAVTAPYDLALFCPSRIWSFDLIELF